jgi:VWFA-related protein
MPRFTSAFFIGVLLFAQDTTIRVTTRLVEVNVVVHDSHGPVSGLTQKDFKIFDKGKEQPIALFTANNAAKPSLKPESAATAAKSTPPPGVFTNRASPGHDSPTSATVLLIDALNTEVADQQVAQKQILKFLTSLDPHRRVAIYVLSRRIRVLQDFTSDSALLTKAVNNLKAQQSGALAGSTAATPGDPVNKSEEWYGVDADATVLGLRESFAEMRDAHNLDRVQLTLAALEQIARHLAQVPGRKSLIWISGSFPLYLIDDERHSSLAANRENRTFIEETSQASRALTAADVAIYPVDARGLLGAPDLDASQHSNGLTNPRGRAFGTKGNGQLGANSVDTPEGLDSMRDLAAGTGGVAYVNSNDIKGAIAKAISDADASYTLAFYADASATDGFHELKVKVDRPGVDVRSRKGYFADAKKAPTETEVGAILHDTATGALDATAIGLIAAMDSTRLALHISFEDLSLEKQNGKWIGGIDVAYVSQSADGRPLTYVTKKIGFELSEEAYQAKRREGLTLEQPIESKKGLARVRVAILDERSGATGSLSVTPPH